ncbi:MAG TPA: NAD(P)H-binding protein [Haliangium sp.]|nr:NAD(P)H-binding protein [Haliangium sp.]
MILIIGATGTIGRDMVPMLTGMGVPVRAMARDPERARALPGFAGADVLFGDAALPETLAAACAGVEKLMLVLIRHVDLSAAEYEQACIAAGASAWLATEIVDIYSKGYYGTGKAGHVTDTVRALLGREPRSFRQFIRDHAGLLAP